MKLCTVISKREFKTLLRDHRLICDHKNKSCMANQNNQFKIAYDFISDKLREKTFSTIKYPRWAWYKIEAEDPKSHIEKYGNKSISIKKNDMIIEFEKNDNKVLLSDSDLWTIVLMNGYIANTEEKDDAFSAKVKKEGLIERELFYPPYIKQLSEDDKIKARQFQEEIRKTWDDVFDLDDNSPYSRYKEKSIQAVFWELKESDIISIKKW